jgi:hypothetical protein
MLLMAWGRQIFVRVARQPPSPSVEIIYSKREFPRKTYLYQETNEILQALTFPAMPVFWCMVIIKTI